MATTSFGMQPGRTHNRHRDEYVNQQLKNWYAQLRHHNLPARPEELHAMKRKFEREYDEMYDYHGMDSVSAESYYGNVAAQPAQPKKPNLLILLTKVS